MAFSRASNSRSFKAVKEGEMLFMSSFFKVFQIERALCKNAKHSLFLYSPFLLFVRLIIMWIGCTKNRKLQLTRTAATVILCICYLGALGGGKGCLFKWLPSSKKQVNIKPFLFFSLSICL